MSQAVAGPYLLPAGDYPFTMAVFVEAHPMRLAWALTVLKPEYHLLRALEIPPVAQWVGEPVDAVILKPDEWPQAWTRCVE